MIFWMKLKSCTSLLQHNFFIMQLQWINLQNHLKDASKLFAMNNLSGKIIKFFAWSVASWLWFHQNYMFSCSMKFWKWFSFMDYRYFSEYLTFSIHYVYSVLFDEVSHVISFGCQNELVIEPNLKLGVYYTFCEYLCQ